MADDTTQASPPPADRVFLRLETGMHTAAISRLSLSADGCLALTASDDKTARLWSLPDLRPVGVLRPELGFGDDGKLYAAALSPDGRLAAVAGWSAGGRSHSIYVFDVAGGGLVQRLGGLPNVVNHLVFSPDGRRLAATLGGKNGIRVWDAGRWTLAGEDRDYGGESYGASFAADGRLATTCYDGHIRLYDAGLGLIGKAAGKGGARPFGIAFSSDGLNLAVGFRDKPAVEVHSATADLPLLAASPALSGGSLSSVAWSSDGSTILAAGRSPEAGETRKIVDWAWPSGAIARRQAGTTDTVMGLAPLPARAGMLVASAEPALLHLNAAFEVRDEQRTANRDMRGITLLIDGSGQRVALAKEGETLAAFDTRLRSLTDSVPDVPLAAPVAEARGVSATGWEDEHEPRVNGRLLRLDQFEISRSVSVQDRQALLGTEWWLRLVDADAKEVRRTAIESVAWAVNLSGDGRLAMAALGDGTIRWYRRRDLAEVLALFLHNDGKRWVAWLPSGHYAASAGGEELIGWHVNNGHDHAADFYPVARFRDRYYLPEAVSLVLETLDPAQAVARARAAAKLGAPEPADKAPPVGTGLPVIEILEPADGTAVPDGRIALKYRTRYPADDAPWYVEVRRDGAVHGFEPIFDPGVVEAAGTVELALTGDRVNLSLVAVNRLGPSLPARVAIEMRTAKPQRKRNLFIFAAGIGPGYGGSHLSPLKWAPKDAEDFSQAMMRQQGGLYGRVTPWTIKDGTAQVTRNIILKGLDWLKKTVTPDDMAMVFLSGHGTSIGQDKFHFLTPDTDFGDLETTSVSGDEIRRALAEIKGIRMLFLDACRSGAVMRGERGKDLPPNIDRFANELQGADSGVVVFTASSGHSFSLESDAWRNGAFTRALVEGLDGAAAHHRDGDITISLLEDHISRTVDKLTQGRQKPYVGRPQAVSNIPIAVKRSDSPTPPAG